MAHRLIARKSLLLAAVFGLALGASTTYAHVSSINVNSGLWWYNYPHNAHQTVLGTHQFTQSVLGYATAAYPNTTSLSLTQAQFTAASFPTPGLPIYYMGSQVYDEQGTNSKTYFDLLCIHLNQGNQSFSLIPSWYVPNLGPSNKSVVWQQALVKGNSCFDIVASGVHYSRWWASN